MGNAKWVHMIFVGAGLILAYVATQATEWIWSYFARPKEGYTIAVGGAIGLISAFIAWRNQNLFTKATEIMNELMKVTWPSRKETSAATVVVIITTLIFAFFLGIFDLIWSWATGMIYT